MHRFVAHLFFGFASAFIAALAVPAHAQPTGVAAPYAFGGVVDLSAWDFDRHGPVALTGDWLFYPGQIVPPAAAQGDISGPLDGAPPIFAPVPAGWREMARDGGRGEGAAQPGRRLSAGTYQITIRLPPETPQLAFYSPGIPSAARVLTDAAEIARSGTPGNTVRTEQPNARPIYALLPESRDGELALVLQVSNFAHVDGGLVRPVWIGAADVLSGIQDGRHRTGFIVLGCSLALAGFFSVLYFWRRWEPVAGLFSLFLALLALRSFVSFGLVGEVVPELDYSAEIRLDYVTLFLLPPMVQMILQTLFPQDSSIVVTRIAWAFGGLGAALSLLTPPDVFTRLDIGIASLALFVGSAAAITLWLAASTGRTGARQGLVVLALTTLACLHAVWPSVRMDPAPIDYVPIALLLLAVLPASLFSQQLRNAQERLRAVPEQMARNRAGMEAEFARTTTMLGETVEELRRRETKLRQRNDELVTLNTEKNRFFSIMAHDLRAPFQALMGFAEVLRDRAPELDAVSVQDYARNIQGAGKSVLDLLDNLLQWARLQMDQVRFQPQPRDLAEIVDNAVEAMRPIANEKSVRIVTEVRSKAVYVDYDMILSVLRNLISNGIKFTDGGGEVRVLAHDEGRFAVLQVRDTGIGMSDEQLARLFRLDTQSLSSGTRGESGTGLGLILCRDLLAKHGGGIELSSELGHGTTATIRLPRRADDLPAD